MTQNLLFFLGGGDTTINGAEKNFFKKILKILQKFEKFCNFLNKKYQ